MLLVLKEAGPRLLLLNTAHLNGDREVFFSVLHVRTEEGCFANKFIHVTHDWHFVGRISLVPKIVEGEEFILS